MGSRAQAAEWGSAGAWELRGAPSPIPPRRIPALSSGDQQGWGCSGASSPLCSWGELFLGGPLGCPSLCQLAAAGSLHHTLCLTCCCPGPGGLLVAPKLHRHSSGAGLGLESPQPPRGGRWRMKTSCSASHVWLFLPLSPWGGFPLLHPHPSGDDFSSLPCSRPSGGHLEAEEHNPSVPVWLLPAGKAWAQEGLVLCKGL